MRKNTSQSGRAVVVALSVAMLLGAAACSKDTPQSLVQSGQQYLDKNDPAAAAIQFKSALQLDSKDVQARLLLGKALMATGDVAGAVTELGRALDQGAPADDVVPALARALLLTGQYDKITGVYGGMKLGNPRAVADLQSSVASAWGALGDKNKTVAAAGAALAADSGYGPALVLQARLLAGEGKFDQALVALDKANAADARLDDAWVLKAEILEIAQNKPKDAAEAYRKALAINRSNVQAHMALVAQAVRARDIPAAKTQADALRAAQPKHPTTVYIDTQLALLDNKPQQARELVQQLVRVFPNHMQTIMLAAAVEAQLGNLMQAEAHLSKATQLSPSSVIARRQLAEVYVRLGQPAKALETLKSLLDTPRPAAEVLALAGDAELRQGNATAAEAYFQRASRAFPDDARLKTAVALAQLSRGDAGKVFADLQTLSANVADTYPDDAVFAARLKRGEYTEALAALDVIAKKNPQRSDLLELRGRVHTARKDYPAARQAYEQALKADPARFAAVAGLANVDVLEKKLDQATKRLEEAVKTQPRNPYALLALAEVRMLADAPVDEVKQLLGDAVKLAPTDPAPRLQLINYALRKRQLKDALAAAQDAATALPNDASVLDAVGRAQLEAGDTEQAITTYRRLAANEPNAPLAYVRLASIFNAAGKRSQAEAALNKALEIRPDLVPAQTALVDMLVASNRSKDALAFARKLQSDRSAQVSGYLLEASIHQRAKSTDAAVAAYRAGLAKVGDSSELARGLYRLLLANGRDPAAEQFAAAWIKAHPQDVAFEYVMAEADITNNRLPMAEERLRRVLAAYPDNALAHNNMAWVLTQANKPGGVTHAQRAVDLVPNQAPLLDTLAFALAHDNQMAPALAAQRRAVELAPTDQSLRLGLAKIALKAGDKATAKTELERLKALGPGFAQQAEVGRLLTTL